MKLIFRGGANEVGRSCIELQTQGDRYLFDCGIKFQEDGFLYPKGIFDVPDLDGVFLSHAHLDHSGGLPFFEHKDLRGPIFCTRQTRELTRILLKDSYEVARIRNIHAAFDRADLREVKKDISVVKFNKRYAHRDIHFTYYNAGHIPGSASILLEAEGKKILYSGDFNLKESMLMKAADTSYVNQDIDVLITEATYGDRTLPPRKVLGQRLITAIKKVIKRGGRVLIPAFAVGRAQEVLQILSMEKFDVPIYLDGMAKRVTRNVLTQPSEYVHHKDELARMFYDVVRMPKNQAHRNEIATKPGIFVTTSGMVQGGPVLHYLKHMWHDKKSAIFLTGYQCRRTNGRELLETGYVYIKGWRTKVLCEVKQYAFSGHSDKKDVQNFLRKARPKILVIQHGDPSAVESLGAWAKEELDSEVFGPKVGDHIKF